MISLTFPDGSSPRLQARRHGPRRCRVDRQVARPRRPWRWRSTARSRTSPSRSRPTPRSAFLTRDDPGSARADPPRRRACHGRGRAGALSRHASDHRAGDRERLLLRLRPRRAVHAGRSAGHRSQDARDHRARLALHLRGHGPRRGEEAVRRQGRDVQARADRRHPRRRRDQDLFASANGSISAAARI